MKHIRQVLCIAIISLLLICSVGCSSADEGFLGEWYLSNITNGTMTMTAQEAGMEGTMGEMGFAEDGRAYWGYDSDAKWKKGMGNNYILTLSNGIEFKLNYTEGKIELTSDMEEGTMVYQKAG